jgi:hypothetical protein
MKTATTSILFAIPLSFGKHHRLINNNNNNSLLLHKMIVWDFRQLLPKMVRLWKEEEQPQSEYPQEAASSTSASLDWHGAPRFHNQTSRPV